MNIKGEPEADSRRSLPTPAAEALVLLAFVGLAALLTWPLVLQLDGQIIGYQNCTNRMHVWVLWVVKQMIWSGDLSLTTDYIFYPNGSNLVRLYGSDLLYPVVLSPLVHLLGPAMVYNCKILFSFAAAPYGAYLILRHLRVTRPAAWCGGAVFIATPYFLLETFNGVSELVSVEWIPFAILFLLRVQDRGRMRDVALAALFFCLSTYASGYNAFFLLLFGVVYLPVVSITLFRQRRPWRELRIKQLIILGALCGIGLVPLAVLHKMSDTSKSVESEHSGMLQPSLNPGSDSSAELVTFFRPGRNEIPLVSRDGDGNMHKKFTTYTTYMGYGVLALALVGVLGYRQRSRLWWIMALFFFLVALGPFLRFKDVPMTIGDYGIPMPSIVLYYLIPGFEVTVRHTYRYVTMLHLVMAVLAGLGLQWLIAAQLSAAKRHFIVAGALALCLTEVLAFGPAPYPVPRTPREVPGVYQELARHKETYGIVELPYEDYLDYLQPLLFYQTVHGKKLLAGAVHHRIGPPELALINKVPLATNFMHEETIASRLKGIEARASVQALYRANFRYVIMHDRMFKSAAMAARANKFLTGVLGQPQLKPGGIRVYEIRDLGK